MSKFYDTNALLELSDELDTLDFFYTSSVVLEELEHIKTSKNKTEDLRYKARCVSRFLRDNDEKYECVIVKDEVYNILHEYRLPETNDNLIVTCAYIKNLDLNGDIIYVSNDICCYNIAKNIFNLNTEKVEKEENDNYKGYKKIEASDEDIGKIFEEYLNGNNILKLLENEYLIIHNIDTDKIIENKYINNKLERLKLPPSNIIKGWNVKQRCALDLLMNKDIPIKIIAGTYGSGKTKLAVKLGLYHILDKGTYAKMLLVRNPVGSGEEIGFIKGTKEDKIKEFYAPIEQNLDGGEYQMQDMLAKGQIECQIPYYMKGMSLNQTFMLVDECEDLDKNLFKLIGTRIGENSCAVFTGDWKQAETKYVHNNGLSQFIQYAKGNPLVGIIVLDEDVRSDASKIFADF
jgi:PhoH-like ATPase